MKEYTYNERLVIEEAVYCEMGDIQRARHLLRFIAEEYFCGTQPPKIDQYHLEHIGEMLYTIDEVLFHALLSYGLTVGDTGIDGVTAPVNITQDGALVLKANEIANKATDKYKSVHDPAAQAYHAKLRPLFDLPDKEMIPAVEAFLRGAGE